MTKSTPSKGAWKYDEKKINGIGGQLFDGTRELLG
jgi:hypothetical protein